MGVHYFVYNQGGFLVFFVGGVLGHSFVELFGQLGGFGLFTIGGSISLFGNGLTIFTKFVSHAGVPHTLVTTIVNCLTILGQSRVRTNNVFSITCFVGFTFCPV